MCGTAERRPWRDDRYAEEVRRDAAMERRFRTTWSGSRFPLEFPTPSADDTSMTATATTTTTAPVAGTVASLKYVDRVCVARHAVTIIRNCAAMTVHARIMELIENAGMLSLEGSASDVADSAHQQHRRAILELEEDIADVWQKMAAFGLSRDAITELVEVDR